MVNGHLISVRHSLSRIGLTLGENQQGFVLGELGFIVDENGDGVSTIHLVDTLRLNNIAAQVYGGDANFDFLGTDRAFCGDIRELLHDVFLLSADKV